jgi:hypothetical protein
MTIGGVFYARGCVSQLLTVPNWTVACGQTVEPSANYSKVVFDGSCHTLRVRRE